MKIILFHHHYLDKDGWIPAFQLSFPDQSLTRFFGPNPTGFGFKLEAQVKEQNRRLAWEMIQSIAPGASLDERPE
ncbi:MAG TPA: hypothetical protein VND20_07040 [Candidatus Binataceae bacterium]|nr:hypothetical protein [Candidatus Binataceae bacterium]